MSGSPGIVTDLLQAGGGDHVAVVVVGVIVPILLAVVVVKVVANRTVKTAFNAGVYQLEVNSILLVMKLTA